MRQNAKEWAEEGIAKYGLGAAAWIGRWKCNLANYPEDLKILDEALRILEEQK